MADVRRTGSIGTSAPAPDEVAGRTFSISRRGFDTNEVRSYLAQVAAALREAADREAELRRQVADAEDRAAHPTFDEAVLTTVLGEETTRVLRSAREAAADIKVKAEENVALLLREAHEQASRIRAEAELVLAREVEEAEKAGNEITERAQAEASAALHRARQEAEGLLNDVRTEARAMVEEAQAKRAKVLGDLNRRRRVVATQVEQLRAGRERLLEAYRLVRSTLDEVTDELSRAEVEARGAADAAARRLAGEAVGDEGEEVDTDELEEHEAPDEAPAAGPAAAEATPVSAPAASPPAQPAPAAPAPPAEQQPAAPAAAGAATAATAATAASPPDRPAASTEPALITTTPDAKPGRAATVTRITVPEGPGEERRLSSLRILRPRRDSAGPTARNGTTSAPPAEAPPGDAPPAPAAPAAGPADAPATGAPSAGSADRADAPTEPAAAAAPAAEAAPVPAHSDAVDAGAGAEGGDELDVIEPPSSVERVRVIGASLAGGTSGPSVTELESPSAEPPGVGAAGVDRPGHDAPAPVPEEGHDAAAEEPASPTEPPLPEDDHAAAGVEDEPLPEEEGGPVDPSPDVDGAEAPAADEKVEPAPADPDAARGEAETEREPADAGAVAAPGSGGGSGADDIFARIRAERAEAVARAREVLADTAETASAVLVAAAPVVTGEPAADEPAGDAPAEESQAAPSGDDAIPDEVEAALQQRDAAVEGIEARLAKRLKRALQDEQNDVLDRLRHQRGRPTADTVLPTEEEQRARYRAVAFGFVVEAAAAGADLAGDAAATGEVDDLADALADTVVGPLRRRLHRGIEAGADEDAHLLVERIGAAYREFKGERIERMASDHVIAAFSRGTLAAVGTGTGVRWLVDDGGPCPDCDDNALAGDLPAGDAFPTGQRHPPAHGGCRCLLVRAPT